MSKIKYNQEYLKDLSLKLNQISTNLSSSVNNSASLLDNDTLYGGIKKFNENMQIIGNRVRNTSSIVTRQGSSFEEGEIYIEKVFDSIEIPEELANIYSPLGIVSNEAHLDKKDGKAVNKSDIEEQVSMSDNYELTKEDLYELESSNQEVQELDDNYGESTVDLNNIATEKTATQEYEDSYDTEKIALESIAIEEPKKQEFEDDYSEHRVRIFNINKNGQ